MKSIMPVWPEGVIAAKTVSGDQWVFYYEYRHMNNYLTNPLEIDFPDKISLLDYSWRNVNPYRIIPPYQRLQKENRWLNTYTQ